MLKEIRCFSRHAMFAPARASGSPPNHLIMVVGFSLPTLLAGNLIKCGQSWWHGETVHFNGPVEGHNCKLEIQSKSCISCTASVLNLQSYTSEHWEANNCGSREFFSNPGGSTTDTAPLTANDPNLLMLLDFMKTLQKRCFFESEHSRIQMIQ